MPAFLERALAGAGFLASLGETWRGFAFEADEADLKRRFSSSVQICAQIALAR